MNEEGPYTYSAAAQKLPETDLTRRGIIHANKMDLEGHHTTGTVLAGLVAEVERLREINSELVCTHNSMLVHKDNRDIDPRYQGLLFLETQPCMLFLFPGSGPGQAWLIALHSDFLRTVPRGSALAFG